ncbi:hypothetical protein RRG08_060800 [Elysia crispata]|uniref:Uncharacterized protein n=1 Tax=Elysia crispata TaxID=231223 RepID=A0AAE1D6E5_9GAST|nr:hypothetical protein RRG08_060800 [Elysia crispata]
MCSPFKFQKFPENDVSASEDEITANEQVTSDFTDLAENKFNHIETNCLTQPNLRETILCSSTPVIYGGPFSQRENPLLNQEMPENADQLSLWSLGSISAQNSETREALLRAPDCKADCFLTVGHSNNSSPTGLSASLKTQRNQEQNGMWAGPRLDRSGCGW